MFWSHRQRGQTRHLDSLPWGVARPTAPALLTAEPWPCRARPHSWKFYICTSPEASFFRLSGEVSGLRHVYQRCVSRYTPGLQLSFEEGTWEGRSWEEGQAQWEKPETRTGSLAAPVSPRTCRAMLQGHPPPLWAQRGRRVLSTLTSQPFMSFMMEEPVLPTAGANSHMQLFQLN